ncbi:hypothetical protein PILCRDRAFT_740497 [Piloderma croceum F 1598]|uniref:Uncharacterized protein n=1 Tax=Piloderma croceum (strain F 1598) TaxID=765440 RepID=A0A0C3EXF3_PILCF|nr:hypothetical protein PILCRDRAFT_740497 [Piloderma croceum F 1598]
MSQLVYLYSLSPLVPPLSFDSPLCFLVLLNSSFYAALSVFFLTLFCRFCNFHIICRMRYLDHPSYHLVCDREVELVQLTYLMFYALDSTPFFIFN